MGMTALEKFETSERIADYFELDETAYDWQIYNEQASICYGKIDPIHIDGIADVIRDVRQEVFGSDNKHERIRHVLTSHDRFALINLLQLLRPKVFNEKTSFNARVMCYLVHSRLTELGVAPRWREVKKPSKQKSHEWNEQQKRFLCDLQVFDMHWIHATYPKHRVMGVFNGVFEKLFDADVFDFSRAQVLAHAEITLKNKIKFLKINEDMECELNMLRSPSIESAIQKLDRNAQRVENDLNLAANRNRRRGNKLLRAMPDKLMVWKSTALMPTDSITVMHENYKKLSGKEVSRSTYVSKLKSLNAALSEVSSVFVLDFLE